MSGETFGAMLKRFRLERLWSQRELARRAFVSKGMVCHVEAGRTGHYTRETVGSIAAGLGLNGVDTARLLIAAGYFPWQMSDAAVTAFVAAVEQASAIGTDEAAPTELRRRTG